MVSRPGKIFFPPVSRPGRIAKSAAARDFPIRKTKSENLFSLTGAVLKSRFESPECFFSAAPRVRILSPGEAFGLFRGFHRDPVPSAGLRACPARSPCSLHSPYQFCGTPVPAPQIPLIRYFAMHKIREIHQYRLENTGNGIILHRKKRSGRLFCGALLYPKQSRFSVFLFEFYKLLFLQQPALCCPDFGKAGRKCHFWKTNFI